MRYVAPTSIAGILSRGKSVEQFLGGVETPSGRGIRWLELRPANGVIEVWDYRAPDFGDIDHLDLYEFCGDTPSSPLTTVSSAAAALDFAESIGAVIGRWVNQFVCQDEYRDYIEAGRPAR